MGCVLAVLLVPSAVVFLVFNNIRPWDLWCSSFADELFRFTDRVSFWLEAPEVRTRDGKKKG